MNIKTRYSTIEEVQKVCAELRNDCVPNSVGRLAIALSKGQAALLVDPGFIAYANAVICVPENDYNSYASSVSNAVVSWENTVLHPAQVIRQKIKNQ